MRLPCVSVYVTGMTYNYNCANTRGSSECLVNLASLCTVVPFAAVAGYADEREKAVLQACIYIHRLMAVCPVPRYLNLWLSFLEHTLLNRVKLKSLKPVGSSTRRTVLVSRPF